MQQTAQVRFVFGRELIGGWAGAESCNGLANARGDYQQHSGDGEGTRYEERKPVHTSMILHRGREDRFREATGIPRAKRKTGHLGARGGRSRDRPSLASTQRSAVPILRRLSEGAVEHTSAITRGDAILEKAPSAKRQADRLHIVDGDHASLKGLWATVTSLAVPVRPLGRITNERVDGYGRLLWVCG